MRKLLNLPQDRSPTLAEMNAEAQEWGFPTWEEFSAEIDRQLEKRAAEIEELDEYYDFGEIISHVNPR